MTTAPSPRRIAPGTSPTDAAALSGAPARLAEAEREIARLQNEVARRERAIQFQEALFAISEVASSSKPTGEVLAALHRIVGTLMYAENFFIAQWEASARTLRFIYFADSEDPIGIDPDVAFHESELPGSLTLEVIARGQALRGPSAQLAASLGIEEDSQGPDSNDWLGVPMATDGETVGAVVVQSYRPEHTYSAEDEQLLTYVAEHIAAALSRRQSTLELERRVQLRTEALQSEVLERERAERLQAALYRITALTARHEAEDDERALYAAVHAVVSEIMDASNLFVARYDEDDDEVYFPYVGDERHDVVPSRRGGRGLTEYVIHRGEALLADGPTIRGLEATGVVELLGAPAESWLGVPLRVGGAPVGVIGVQSYRRDLRHTERDLELLSFVATHISTAVGRRRSSTALRQAYLDLERRVAERTRELGLANETLRQQINAREGVERQLKHQALHDSLTGLPNRQYLLDRLVASMARYRAQHEQLFAVLFLDLDRFKVINDSEGHLVGDALLREAAKRIGECVRNPDTLARLGGDEFAVLLERIRSVDDAVHVAERIMQVLDEPFLIEGRELHSSASVGIALAQPQYASAEEILRDADAAMYRAKADGRKRYALFDENLRHFAQQRLELEREMRRALAQDEFEPHYQPIVSIANGAVLGYEALLRWRRPDGQLRAPGAFLGLAEETGMIEEIDWRMYSRAIGDLARIAPAHAYVSVNLSPRHLLAPDFAARFLELVRDQRAQPSRVCVEVTEGALIDRKDLARAALETLHRAGVRIMLDDFGTGYSALSYLQHFPLHGLKIDRSFATALDGGGEARSGSRPIIRAIVAMAASLELEVVSEGIETDDQRKALWTLGVRQGQGYHFGRPAPLQHWIDLGATPPAD
jgi:diguanylate cyclase (GGDEF)-like protein